MFDLSASCFSLGWLVPAGVGNAGGLMVPNAHKSAPGTPHPGEKKHRACPTQQPPACSLLARATRGANNRSRTTQAAAQCRCRSYSAHRTSAAKCDARAITRADRASGSPNAVGTGLSSAADCGYRAGACLSAASLRPTPQAVSSARNRAAALSSARLFFGSFLLAKQKK